MVATCWVQRSCAVETRPHARFERRPWRFTLAVKALHGMPHLRSAARRTPTATEAETSTGPTASMQLIEEKEVVNREGAFDTLAALC